MKIRKPKERGEWAELRFMTKATEQGYKLTKPWGDSSPYDFVIDLGGRFVSVQVKSTSYQKHPETKRHRSGSFGCNLRPSRSPRYQSCDFD
jgi:PD-(D/E)XK endonuclease